MSNIVGLTFFAGAKGPGPISGVPNVDAGNRLSSMIILSPPAAGATGLVSMLAAGKSANALVSSYVAEGGVVMQLANEDLSNSVIVALVWDGPPGA